jgi:general secretion pathway protein G
MVRKYSSRRGGFTLIEILIVVIILGILAAIVIPQFSSASNDARKSNVQSTVQTLRSQIALYKLQHQDTLPDLVTNWNPMLLKTDASGSSTPAAGVQTFGPYMQDTPTNSLNGKTTVGDGTGNVTTAVGFVYDYAAGAGSGKLWGTDIDGKTVLP